MIFKIQKLNSCVHVVRGYQKEDDIKYSFVCTLYKKAVDDRWNILATMTDGGGTIQEIRETLNYLKNYPCGVYTYVSEKDWQRFYKRYCRKINFDDCEF